MKASRWRSTTRPPERKETLDRVRLDAARPRAAALREHDDAAVRIDRLQARHAIVDEVVLVDDGHREADAHLLRFPSKADVAVCFGSIGSRANPSFGSRCETIDPMYLTVRIAGREQSEQIPLGDGDSMQDELARFLNRQGPYAQMWIRLASGEYVRYDAIESVKPA
jgi:hypothetical protein